jgi:hypothetical protein
MIQIRSDKYDNITIYQYELPMVIIDYIFFPFGGYQPQAEPPWGALLCAAATSPGPKLYDSAWPENARVMWGFPNMVLQLDILKKKKTP